MIWTHRLVWVLLVTLAWGVVIFLAAGYFMVSSAGMSDQPGVIVK